MPGRLTAFFAAVAVVAAAPVPVLADSQIDISGQAPLICSAGVSGAPGASGATISLGDLNEFCNDPSGYDVWIDYPAAFDNGSLVVNGVAMPLSAAGTIEVTHATAPGQAQLVLAYTGASVTGPVTLTIRMIPD